MSKLGTPLSRLLAVFTAVTVAVGMSFLAVDVEAATPLAPSEWDCELTFVEHGVWDAVCTQGEILVLAYGCWGDHLSPFESGLWQCDLILWYGPGDDPIPEAIRDELPDLFRGHQPNIRVMSPTGSSQPRNPTGWTRNGP